jgi:Flp pilus assembly protein TadD
MQYFEEASALDPLNWFPYTDIANEYASRGQFAEAEAAYRKAEQLTPVVNFAAAMGYIHLLEGGDPAAALAQINRESTRAVAPVT